METARAVNTPHLISDKENYNIRLRDLSSKLDPVFNLMKITGIFHGDNSLNGNRIINTGTLQVLFAFTVFS